MVFSAGVPGHQPAQRQAPTTGRAATGAVPVTTALALPSAALDDSPVRGRIVFVLGGPTTIGPAESLAHGLTALPDWRGADGPSHLVRDLILPTVRAHAASAASGSGLSRLVDGPSLGRALRVLCDRVLTAAAGSAAYLVELVPDEPAVAELLAILYPDARRITVTDDSIAPGSTGTHNVTSREIRTDPRAALATGAELDTVHHGAVRALHRNQSPRGEHRVVRDLLATPAAAAGLPLAVLTAQPGSGADWLLELLAVHPQVLVGPPGGSGLFAALAAAWRAALDPASALHELAGSAVLIEAVRHFADSLLLSYTASVGRPDAVVVDLVTDIDDLATARGLRPDAAFVHLIRDGRAVAAMSPGGPGEVAGRSAGHAWATDVTRRRAVLVRSQHHSEVRLEDVVAAPLRRLDALIELFELGCDLATIDAFGAAAAASKGPPPPPPVPATLLGEITAGAEPLLAELGYR